MTLWFFSSGDGDSNAEMDEDLLQRLGKNRPKLTFIPSGFADAEYYYEEFIERFALHGCKDFSILHVDKPFPERALAKALAGDLIYLSGGNTFYFLKHLKRSGVATALRGYYRRGGHLAGHSAGGIIMTRTIKTAGFPEFDRDDNLVGLTDWRALNLVRFEIFPHYNGRDIYAEELAYQSHGMGHPLYAIPDGAGIAVDDLKLSFYGPVTGFLRGVKFKLGG